MFRSLITLSFFFGISSLFAASEGELEDGIPMEWYERAALNIAYEGVGGAYLAVNAQQDLITGDLRTGTLPCMGDQPSLERFSPWLFRIGPLAGRTSMSGRK